MQRDKGWPGEQVTVVPRGYSPKGPQPWLPGESGGAQQGLSCQPAQMKGAWFTAILGPGQVTPKSPHLVPLLAGTVHSFIYSFPQLIFTEDLQMCQALSWTSQFWL